MFRLWYNVHGLSKLALRLHLARNLAHATLVGSTVLLEEVERVGLGGVARVRVVEQVLDTQQDLLDGDCRLPALFLICVRQTTYLESTGRLCPKERRWGERAAA